MSYCNKHARVYLSEQGCPRCYSEAHKQHRDFKTAVAEPAVDPQVEAQLMRIERVRSQAECVKGLQYLNIPLEVNLALELCELATEAAQARAVRASEATKERATSDVRQ